MSSANRQIKKLEKIIKLATEMIDEMRNGVESPVVSRRRKRRSGKELIAFRRMLKAERKKGVPAAELAERHGVSPAYIYQLR